MEKTAETEKTAENLPTQDARVQNEEAVMIEEPVKIEENPDKLYNSYKTNMRILTSLTLAVFLVVSFVAFAQDGKANFSGKWSLNNDKTLYEGHRTSAQRQLNIRQEGNDLTIDRISQGRSGEEIISEKFTLDGKVKDSVISGKPTKSAVSWSTDGKKMTISYMILFAQDDIRTTIEIWQLSEDGRSLSVNYSSQSAKGTRNATYVYDKKQ